MTRLNAHDTHPVTHIDVLPPFLTQAEINQICAPLKQPAAQIRYMTAVLGLTVERKPGGQALVWRSHVEAVKGPALAGRSRQTTISDTIPSAGNLVSFLQGRGRKYGTTS